MNVIQFATRALNAAACFANCHPRATQLALAALATAAICFAVYGFVTLVQLGWPGIFLAAAAVIAAFALATK
jgi:hypothetical protein